MLSRKYITFSVPISKELDNGKTMSTSLSSLADNLSEIYKKRMQGSRGKKKKSNQYAILKGLKIIN